MLALVRTRVLALDLVLDQTEQLFVKNACLYGPLLLSLVKVTIYGKGEGHTLHETTNCLNQSNVQQLEVFFWCPKFIKSIRCLSYPELW